MTIYKYKDANRDWWEISIIDIDRVQNKEVDCIDYKWCYTIYKEDRAVSKEIFTNEIIGQYEQEPSLQEILIDFSCYIQDIVINFSVDGVKIPS